MQATVAAFDPAGRSGSVVTDDGVLLPFGPEVFARSGLRHLRPGQRLTVRVETPAPDAPAVVAMGLGTVGAPPSRRSHP